MSTPLKKPSNRSQEIRARRDQKSQPRSKSPARQAAAPAGMARPPVVLRSTSGVLMAAPRQQPQPASRKKVYYKVGEHTEVSMPALPALKIGTKLVSGLLFAGLTTLLIFLLAAPGFHVQDMGMSGNKRIKKADVFAALDLNKMSSFGLDPQAIRADLAKKYPEFADVRVSISLPATINISVRERMPVLAWEGNGETVWLDAEGVVMPARGEMDALLTIHSDSSAPTIDASAEAAANKDAAAISRQPLASPLKKVDPALIVKMIRFSEQVPSGAEMTYTQDHGFGWSIDGHRVFVGFKLDNIDLKMAEAKAILEAMKERGVSVSFLSVAHENAPVIKE